MQVPALTSTAASAPVAPPATTHLPLALLVELGRGLEHSGIEYCHWKSNAAIDRSASGENDFDLLVRLGDARSLTELLSRLGFVRASKRGASVPGIESFYGFDAASERLVHVHAHYALVVGDDRTKNYRLPLEDAYIRSAIQGDTFRIPAPEVELAVLVLRMVLKYCTWDEILWTRVRGRRAGPKRTEREELEYLSSLADATPAAAFLAAHAPYVDASLFADCVQAVDPRASLAHRLRTGRRLERALQPHGRRSRRLDRTLRISRRVTLAVRRRIRGVDRNRLAGGGAMVAIMGGDGAGKSTALATLERWLGAEFDVRVVHVGKPRWSVTTYAVRAGLKLVHLVGEASARRLRVAPLRRLSLLIERYRPLIWLLCTARDRQRAYHRARRFALGGGLVLCDRYPHPRLTSMEVPRIAHTLGHEPAGRVARAMCRLEEAYHRSIAPPDLLIVLRVHPELAVARKTDEDPDSVRRRGAEIWNIDWRDAGAHVVDGSRPPDAVAGELRALVWSALG